MKLWPLSHFARRLAGPALNGVRIYLRSPVMDDFDEWFTLRSSSRAFLEPWEPTWHPDELKRSTFRHRIWVYRQWSIQDRGHAFYIFDKTTQKLLGAVHMSNIRRGAEQSSTLGYWIGQPYARQGYMSEALQLVLQHAFEKMNLHRVEAACLPRNLASRNLLERTGFEQEGYAKKYIKIAGVWEDHLLFAHLTTINRESP